MAKKKKAKKAIKRAAKRSARTSARKPARKAARKVARKPARKAAPRRAAAKARKPARAAARKAVPARKARSGAAKAKPVVRREDHAGHLDPQYASELRKRSERPPRDPDSFLGKARASDTLVEELGEGYVASANSGEYEAEDSQNQEVSEEVGGPFVQTSGDQEFARGTDASNPKGSTREPFPRT